MIENTPDAPVSNKGEKKLQNPYKYLSYFDTDDGDDFYGRRKLVKKVVENLENRFDDSDLPTAISIVGPSGCGKSSLLRAGILKALKDNDSSKSQYDCLVVEPDDFRNASGQVLSIIGTLLGLIDEQIDIDLTASMLLEISEQGKKVPSTAADLLSQLLVDASKDTPHRLVIGIDQFEEILSTWTSKEDRDRDVWQPLIDFINEAAEKPNIGIVYTLESSHEEAYHQQELGHAFDSANEVKLNDKSGDQLDTFLDSIINDPFQKAGYPLSQNIVKELKDNFKALSQSEDGLYAYGTALPLLSLKLSHLFDEVKELFPPNSSKEDFPFNNQEQAIQAAGLKALGIDLEFSNIIKTQAERAWRHGSRQPIDEKQLEKLEYFLQPFISLENNQIKLNAIPRNLPFDTEQKLAKIFYRDQLMVLVRKNLVRLAHKAVIWHWPVAQVWFKQREPYLIIETRIRARAKDWDLYGRLGCCNQ